MLTAGDPARVPAPRLRAPGRDRTDTRTLLRGLPLPIGLRGRTPHASGVRGRNGGSTYGDPVPVPGPEVCVDRHVPSPHRVAEPAMNRRPQVPVRVMRAVVRGLVRPVLGPRMPVAVQRRWLRV